MKRIKPRLSLLLSFTVCTLIAAACGDTSTQASAPEGNAAQPSSHNSVEITPGTRLVVRMIDSVNSKNNRVGDTFSASLEQPLEADGGIVAPRGTRVYGRLEEVKSAGKIKGKSELRLALTGIEINGSTHSIVTGSYDVHGKSRGKNTAKKVGIGAAVGGVIGAIAGGGKGAAIGAGVGAGAGTAVQVMTHGEQINVPSETVLDFTIEQPVTLPIANA